MENGTVGWFFIPPSCLPSPFLRVNVSFLSVPTKHEKTHPMVKFNYNNENISLFKEKRENFIFTVASPFRSIYCMHCLVERATERERKKIYREKLGFDVVYRILLVWWKFVIPLRKTCFFFRSSIVFQKRAIFHMASQKHEFAKHTNASNETKWKLTLMLNIGFCSKWKWNSRWTTTSK